MGRLFIIGIGYRPLDEGARQAVIRSEALLASPRLAEVFQRYREFDVTKDRLVVKDSVDETFAFIRAAFAEGASTITLLASGDPLFHGIARRAAAEFGTDVIEIMPDLSCIQVAFSRLRLPWDDALLISLHGGPVPTARRKPEYRLDELPSLVFSRPKIAVLTDNVNSPEAIAQTLAESSAAPCPIRMHVCERLGYPDERTLSGSPIEMARASFREPNVVILVNETGGSDQP